MENKFLKFGLITAGLTALAIPIAVLLTSCNKTEQYYASVFKYNAKQTYQSSNDNILRNTSNDNVSNIDTNGKEVLVLDPNVNLDAIEKAKNTFANITKEQLQVDFNKVLTKFFKAYEYEEENGKEDFEAEIERINVKSLNTDFNGNRVANLSVKYEVDDDKKEWIEWKDHEFILKPTFATDTQIEAFKKMLKYQNESNQGNNSVEWDDIYELYVGDPSDREKSIFEQINAIKGNSNLGGLLGYSINISSLRYQRNTRSKLDINTEIFAPSFTMRNFFEPQENIGNNKLDFSLNLDGENGLSSKTLSAWKTNLVQKGSNDNYQNFLNILSNEETRNSLTGKIKNINVNDVMLDNQESVPTPNTKTNTDSKINLLNEKAIEVIVELKDEANDILGTGMPKIFTLIILESWCKQGNTK